MAALPMIITNAGLDAIIDAQLGGTEEVLISEIGLTATPFVMAPTLTALPGEFRRLDTVAGQSVAPNIIHVTAYDPAAVTYSVTGFGLFSDTGVLIAVYSAVVDPVLTKAALATSLFALDIALEADMAAVIAFGDALFLNPPASETVSGVARIATQARVDALADAGDDDRTIVTPKTLRVRLAALLAGLNGAIAALTGRTITGGGLVSGGGDLSANRVLTVTAASGAELLAAAIGDKSVTPAAFGALPRLLGGSGYQALPGGLWLAWGTVTLGANTSATVTMAANFPTSVRRAWLTPETDRDNSDEPDETWWVNPGSFGASGFSISSQGDGSAGSIAWLAIGD